MSTLEHREHEGLDPTPSRAPRLWKGYALSEFEQHYARAYELCAAVGDTVQGFSALWGLLNFQMGTSKLDRARELAVQLVELAEETAAPQDLLEAYDQLVIISVFMGAGATMLPYLERARPLIHPTTERTSALMWELLAAQSLSHLWQAQGKRVAAQHLLAEVYGWFTEGFDSVPLREAQALLASLA